MTHIYIKIKLLLYIPNFLTITTVYPCVQSAESCLFNFRREEIGYKTLSRLKSKCSKYKIKSVVFQLSWTSLTYSPCWLEEHHIIKHALGRYAAPLMLQSQLLQFHECYYKSILTHGFSFLQPLLSGSFWDALQQQELENTNWFQLVLLKPHWGISNRLWHERKSILRPFMAYMRSKTWLDCFKIMKSNQ